MKQRTSRVGLVARMLIVTVVALVVSFQSPPRARAQDNPEPLELDGVGAYETGPLVTAWGSPMFNSSNPVNLSYLPGGDTSGRGQLAAGQVDFAISGRPLSDDDKATLKNRGVDIISAPIAMAATAFIYAAPLDYGLYYVSFTDPNDPESAFTKAQVSTMHVSPAVLSKILSGDEGYTPYVDPEFIGGLGLPAGAQFQKPSLASQAIGRSDPGASNYYLGKYLLQFAPDAYNAHLAQQLLPPGILSESWPFLDMATRSGPNPTFDLLYSNKQPTSGGDDIGGTFGMLDQTSSKALIDKQNAVRTGDQLLVGAPGRLSVLPILNGSGEWVSPTPASITAAGKAGGDTPLYAVSNAAPGAYPFTWTTNLMVPSSGLTVEKANALATFLRYATGPGQDLAAGVNDGVLPDSLRSDAADKADDIVKGNCKAAGGTTKTAKDGGPYWPTGVAVPSGGTLICVAPDGPTTTTTSGSSGSGGSGGGSSSGGSSSNSSGFGPTSFSSGSGGSGSSGSYGSSNSSGSGTGGGQSGGGSNGGDSSGGGGAAATGVLGARTIKADLPLRPPDDGQFALDRFATIMLGGVFFLILRSIVRPRLVGRA